MGDAGVGQHSLEVVRGDRRQRPHHHRDRRQQCQRRGPVVDQRRETRGEDARQGGEPGDLHPGGHHRHRRRRRPLVDIGGPLVERGRRHLEPEPDHEQPDGDQGDRGLEQDGRLEERGDPSDPVDGGRPGGGEGEGDPVEEDRRGRRPEQEVLHRRLFGAHLLPGEPGDDVQADRCRLQPDAILGAIVVTATSSTAWPVAIAVTVISLIVLMLWLALPRSAKA